ncbi:hypothetical protein LP419_01820 [Massilia sp. H-1]|nr:hypothetical protein LP419_01820 [Massilia sp. H-1]
MLHARDLTVYGDSRVVLDDMHAAESAAAPSLAALRRGQGLAAAAGQRGPALDPAPQEQCRRRPVTTGGAALRDAY